MFKEAINLAKPNIELSAEKATAMLYTLADKFLDKAELDEVVSQQVANEIFIAGVNMGMKKAVMLHHVQAMVSFYSSWKWLIR